MKFILPVPITETSYLSSTAGALTDSTVAENSYPTWVANAEYPQETVVEYSAALYRCLRKHRNRSRTPDTDTAFWTTVTGSTTYSVWSASSVAYVVGDVVIRSETHRKYRCATAHTSGTLGASGVNPASEPPEVDTDSSHWVDIGPTNRWAMFDSSPTTATMGTSPLEITIAPGIVDSIALIGLVGATSVNVTMMDGATEVYNTTVDLDDSQPIVDWWDWFFAPFSFRSSFVLSDLPPYQDGEITITITGSSTVGVGILVVGNTVEIAGSEYGIETGIIDYSKKDTDEYGNTTLVERAYAKKLSTPIMVDRALLDYTAAKLTAIRATPVVFYEDTGEEALIVYGFPEDWRINVAYPTYVKVNVSVKGLT